MIFKFRLTFKRGVHTMDVVEGYPVETDHFTVDELQEKVIATEAFLEKLLGLRVHIEQVN